MEVIAGILAGVLNVVSNLVSNFLAPSAEKRKGFVWAILGIGTVLSIIIAVIMNSSHNKLSSVAGLNIRGVSTIPGVYFIEGEGSNELREGDQLVVYDTPTTSGQEEPIALLYVVAPGNNSPLAQVRLSHPEIAVQAGQKVDKSLDSLRASQLVPADLQFDGYVLGEGYIIVRGDRGFEEGEVFRTVESQGIRLFLSEPPIRMSVQEFDINYFSESYSGSIAARVKLLAGEWPEVGTVLMNETESISVVGPVIGFPSGLWKWQGYITLGGGGKISGTLTTDYPSSFVFFALPGGGGYIRGSMAPQKDGIFCLNLPGIDTAIAAITFEGVTTEGDWEINCESSEGTGYFYR